MPVLDRLASALGYGDEVLAAVGAYEQRIFPFLLAFLRDCPPKDLPRRKRSGGSQWGETGLGCSPGWKELLKAAQLRWLEQVMRKLSAL